MRCVPAPSCEVWQLGAIRIGMKRQPLMTLPPSRKLTLPLLSSASTDALSVRVAPSATDDWDVITVVTVWARLGWKDGDAANAVE